MMVPWWEVSLLAVGGSVVGFVIFKIIFAMIFMSDERLWDQIKWWKQEVLSRRSEKKLELGSVYVYVDPRWNETVTTGVVFDSTRSVVDGVLADYVQANVERKTSSALHGVEVLNAQKITVDGRVVWERGHG